MPTCRLRSDPRTGTFTATEWSAACRSRSGPRTVTTSSTSSRSRSRSPSTGRRRRTSCSLRRRGHDDELPDGPRRLGHRRQLARQHGVRLHALLRGRYPCLHAGAAALRDPAEPHRLGRQRVRGRSSARARRRPHRLGAAGRRRDGDRLVRPRRVPSRFRPRRCRRHAGAALDLRPPQPRSRAGPRGARPDAARRGVGGVRRRAHAAGGPPAARRRSPARPARGSRGSGAERDRRARRRRRRPGHGHLGPRRPRLRRRALARRGSRACNPTASTAAVVVEYAAHPAARLYVGTGRLAARVRSRPRRQRDARSGARRRAAGAAARRRRETGAAGAGAAAPARRGRRVPAAARPPPQGERTGSRTTTPSSSTGNQYSYVAGECVVDLPLGTVYVEITRGYEIAPIAHRRSRSTPTTERAHVRAGAGRSHWRERGWVTADTHVHFLSPQTALLEGSGRRRQRRQSARQPVGRDVQQRRRLRRADDASARRTSAATASSWCASAPRTGCRCSATSRCSATPAR